MSGIEVIYEGQLSTRCILEETKEEICTDGPKEIQGRGQFFSPTDLFAASLGSCILTMMGMAAHRMKVELGRTKAFVSKELSKDLPRRIQKIQVRIECPVSFSEEVRLKLETAAKTCPVHHSLHPDMEQQITFQWGSP